MDIDNLGVGFAGSFNFTKKFNSIIPEEFIPNNKINEAPIEDPAAFCHYLKTAEGNEKKIMNFNKGTINFKVQFKISQIVFASNNSHIIRRNPIL